MSIFSCFGSAIDKVAGAAVPVITASNPFAGVLVNAVGAAVEKIDAYSEADDDARREMTLLFAAYLMRIAAELTEAAADGRLTQEEFAKIRKLVAEFPQ